MKFDDEICKGVSCYECPFNKMEDGCLLAKRLDEIEITTETHEERTETHACDLISRQAAIECLEHLSACDEPFVEIGTNDETFIGKYEAITEISDLPSAMEDETKNVERREE